MRDKPGAGRKSKLTAAQKQAVAEPVRMRQVRGFYACQPDEVYRRFQLSSVIESLASSFFTAIWAL